MVRIVRSDRGWWGVRSEHRAAMGSALEAAVYNFRFQRRIAREVAGWSRGLG